MTNPYDTQRTRVPRFDVVDFTTDARPFPTEVTEHIVYESTLEAQYRASAPTVRIPRLELVR